MQAAPREPLGPRAGYTLTEMLVVIGIICVLAAVLTPGLVGQLGRAKAKTAQLQLDSLASAVELYRTDVGRYPTETEGLKALVSAPTDADGWTGPYVRDAKSLNDPWNHPIVYKLEPAGDRFYVESLGADGAPGGTGVNRDIKAPAS